ncbi:MAG: hypothetical protein DHS20C19_01270 [Acidimicrobiales bacterium]|nr:MAG: hypothetical protein DHS20C19_01270 [Acidimicrobiales bacterium]
MARPDHRLWAVWLLGLLLVPLGLTLARVEPNALPGTTTDAPEWDAGRLLDDAYYRSIDDWIRDESNARGAGLWTRHLIDYRLFGDASSPLVAIGDNGWAFSRSWIDVPCADIDAIAAPSGSPFITWTVPIAKSHWLDHLLEPHDRGDACTESARKDLRERMTDDPRGLDVNQAFDDDAAGRFYRRDPHWNGAGRIAVAELIVERFAPGLWDPGAIVATEESLLQGMDRFLGVNDRSTVADVDVDRGITVEHVSDPVDGLGILIWQHSRAHADDVVPGTTYMFGDSQMASVVPEIEQYFEELIFVGWLRAALGPLPYDQLPAPDRVFVEALDQSAAQSFQQPVLAEVIARLPAADDEG